MPIHRPFAHDLTLPSIHPFIHSFIHLFIHAFIYPNAIHSVHPSFHHLSPSIHSFICRIRSFIHSLICRLCSFIYYFFHRSIHPSLVCSFVRPYVAFVLLFFPVRSFSHLLYLFIHTFIHPSVSFIPSAIVLTLRK